MMERFSSTTVKYSFFLREMKIDKFKLASRKTKKQGKEAKEKKVFLTKISFPFFSSTTTNTTTFVFGLFLTACKRKELKARTYVISPLKIVRSSFFSTSFALLHRRRGLKKKKISVVERFIFGKNKIALSKIFCYRFIVALSPSSLLHR